MLLYRFSVVWSLSTKLTMGWCRAGAFPASLVWRSKGAFLPCGSVCLHLDQGFGSWLCCCAVLGLQALFYVHLSIHNLTLCNWLWKAQLLFFLAQILGWLCPSWFSPTCSQCIIEVPVGSSADWRVLLGWQGSNRRISQGCLIVFLLPLSWLSSFLCLVL